MDISQLSSLVGGSASRVATALSSKAGHVKGKETSESSATGTTATTTTEDNTTITANDFLTLLVSELKNQDPTQPTDPTTYIQQLVGVNSLQQLIQINQSVSKFEDAIGSPQTES